MPEPLDGLLRQAFAAVRAPEDAPPGALGAVLQAVARRRQRRVRLAVGFGAAVLVAGATALGTGLSGGSSQTSATRQHPAPAGAQPAVRPVPRGQPRCADVGVGTAGLVCLGAVVPTGGPSGAGGSFRGAPSPAAPAAGNGASSATPGPASAQASGVGSAALAPVPAQPGSTVTVHIGEQLSVLLPAAPAGAAWTAPAAVSPYPSAAGTVLATVSQRLDPASGGASALFVAVGAGTMVVRASEQAMCGAVPCGGPLATWTLLVQVAP